MASCPTFFTVQIVVDVITGVTHHYRNPVPVVRQYFTIKAGLLRFFPSPLIITLASSMGAFDTIALVPVGGSFRVKNIDNDRVFVEKPVSSSSSAPTYTSMPEKSLISSESGNFKTFTDFP